MEGYQEGVRAILLKREAQKPMTNGVYGLVEDIVETEPKYEGVVESVLGERLQHVIVKDHQEVLKAIDYLKTNGSGRSSFIPLQLKQNPALSRTSPAETGAVPLIDVIKVKEEFAHLATFLFGDVLIVSDLREALDLWNRDSIWKTLVTLDGEVLHPSGVVTGGSKAQTGSGTFHRKREIRDLTQGTEELRGQVISQERDQGQLLSTIKNLESSIEGLNQALHQEDLKMVSGTMELDQNQLELKRWMQKIETLQFEESQFAEESSAIQQQAQESTAALQAAEHLKNEKEIDLSRREGELQELKAQIEGLQAEVTEARVRLVGLQEKRQSLDQNVERARRISQEAEAVLRNRRSEVQECLRLIEAAEEQKRGAEADLHRLLSEYQTLQAHLESRKEGLLSEREKLEKAEGQGKERREALQALHEQRNTLSMKLMELDLNLKHLLSTVEEKHRITPEALLAREDERDYFSPEVEARLVELKSLIEAMGEVNLLAIQEYEESKARLEFLTEQEADLVNSLEALDQAIKKINRTSRRRFAKPLPPSTKNSRKSSPPSSTGGGRSFRSWMNPTFWRRGWTSSSSLREKSCRT